MATVLHVALQVVDDAKTLLTPFLPFSSDQVFRLLGGRASGRRCRSCARSRTWTAARATRCSPATTPPRGPLGVHADRGRPQAGPADADLQEARPVDRRRGAGPAGRGRGVTEAGSGAGPDAGRAPPSRAGTRSSRTPRPRPAAPPRRTSRRQAGTQTGGRSRPAGRLRQVRQAQAPLARPGRHPAAGARPVAGPGRRQPHAHRPAGARRRRRGGAGRRGQRRGR